MPIRKYRWSSTYESAEEELLALFENKKIDPSRVHQEASQPVDLTIDTESDLWCAEGSMTLSIDGKQLSLQPGDAVRLQSRAAITLLPGMTGCVYYLNESPRTLLS